MIKVDNCTVTYANGVTALKPTTIGFAEGQFTVLLGPSGAGKSTLLRTLNGLVRPTVGGVTITGLGSIFSNAATLRRHRRSTGMVFQQHHLIGRLTVLQNVLIGRLGAHTAFRTLMPLPAGDRNLALATLDRLGLLERALDRADQLSGGQQQRVGIARAMVQQPRVVLADEPVASLDPTTAQQVLFDLHRVCREDKITAIVSLHQVDLARRYADRIVGLAGGEVVFDGHPKGLDAAVVDRIYGTALELQPGGPLPAAAE